MLRCILIGLVSIVAAAAAYSLARHVGAAPSPRTRGSAVVLQSAEPTVKGHPSGPLHLPTSSASGLPSPEILVLEPPDMSGPPQGLTPIQMPRARVAPNAQDGPPSS